MWSRRAFLASAGAAFATGLAPRGAEALEHADFVFASSIQSLEGNYAVALLSESGALISTVPLPDRGHDVTWSSIAGRAVVFGRQPGMFATVFDPAGKAAPVTLASAEGRHFYGHGTFSHDGQLLYATENDYDAVRGLIGIYETGRYARVGEFETHGVGPHEVLLSPDGRVLVVANGGIETHPDFGRAELNLETMDPSLVFIDTASGGLIGQLRLDAGLHQLSIRHLAFDAKGRVWFGCQFRGDPETTPQLVGYATRDGIIRLIALPDYALRGLRNYIGSVASSRDGTTIAISSPEGDTILCLDAADGALRDMLPLADGCGLAADHLGFVASSGNGDLVGLSGSPLAQHLLDLRFDNHLMRFEQS